MTLLNESPIAQVVVKLTQRCNLNCSYCYVYNRGDLGYLQKPSFMSVEIFEALLHRMHAYCAARPGHKIGLIFHGGEPMLMPASVFDRFATMVTSVMGKTIDYMTVQTNGTLASEDWIAVLQKHEVSVGVSLDGPEDVHDRARVDHTGKGSYRLVANGLKNFQEAGLLTSVICVINPGESGLDCYRHIQTIGVKRINFLLPDATHDSKPFYYPNCGETPIADFLIPIFDEWFNDDDPSIRIPIFNDVLRKLLGGHAEVDSIGGSFGAYIVIDTDGTIQPLDVLNICDRTPAGKRPNVATSAIEDVWQAYFSNWNGADRPCAICKDCREFLICGGGYLPHRFSRSRGFDNPSIWCKDLFRFVQHVRHALISVHENK